MEDIVNIQLKKILRVIGKVLLHLFSLGLIPLDLYVLNIDENLAIALTMIWIVLISVIFALVKNKMRKVEKGDKPKGTQRAGRILFCVLDVFIVILMFVQTKCSPFWNSEAFRNTDWSSDSGNRVLTVEQALSDYDFAMKYLKKIHPLTIDGLPQDVSVQAQTVRAEIESRDSVYGWELSGMLESIFALLGDGHTYVSENYAESHYMKHIYEHRIAGDVLVGINGITLEEMLRGDPALVSYEREEYGIRLLKNRVSTLEGLRYLGIDTSQEITYNYRTVSGAPVDVKVSAEDFLVMEEYLDYEEAATGEDLRKGSDDRDFVSYEIDNDLSLAILTLDDCIYNSHYRETLRQMFEEVYSGNIQNVAVDLRSNSGGSSMVADEFIHYLDVPEYRSWAQEIRYGPFYIREKASTDRNKRSGHGFDGNVYVITSVFTYSSAMDFAMLIQDNGLGQVLGETSGNMPASYGDVVSFQLPGSKLFMKISRKKWHRVDESKEDLPIIPDILCDPDDAIDVLKEKTIDDRS